MYGLLGNVLRVIELNRLLLKFSYKIFSMKVNFKVLKNYSITFSNDKHSSKRLCVLLLIFSNELNDKSNSFNDVKPKKMILFLKND